MSKIIWHGKVISIDDLCHKESLQSITNAMCEQNPSCYAASLDAMSESGFTEYELIQEYLEWADKPLRFN